ncbi:MAG: YdcF family protein [Rhodospirillaceae bacterium]|jgi:uncharacterized SAM-binding protein YcdF (DUF218 family)|nr:YdcF family protein [Rhodospirillaceae bacterium]MBT4219671.1 YdcF family protein [Rhodospirillaceae bacterium]MBT5307743.1 YdcF family protein [Rhodospirillaceae bacterium]
MFFYLSKILWFLADPGNLLLIAISLATLLLYAGRGDRLSRWPRLGRGLLTTTTIIALGISILPIGKAMSLVLEDRFPVVHTPPQKVDGVIVLGGIVNEVITQSRGKISIGGGVERLTELALLSKRYPQAKLVFTGGSGKLLTQNIKEADVVGPLLESLGISSERMIYENRSRNTYENAVYSRELVEPKPGETWILITSAFHTPRAVGSFRKAGWPVVPWPVDFNMTADESLRLGFSLRGGFGSLSSGLHEWLGLIFYRLTGKTDSFFPAPS